MYIQISTTTSNQKEAEHIAQFLVREKLAACVQVVGPIESVYQWKGKMESAKEWICIMKTKKVLYRKIEQVIKRIHSYETPEIIAVPIVAGSKEYLNWIDKETR